MLLINLPLFDRGCTAAAETATSPASPPIMGLEGLEWWLLVNVNVLVSFAPVLCRILSRICSSNLFRCSSAPLLRIVVLLSVLVVGGKAAAAAAEPGAEAAGHALVDPPPYQDDEARQGDCEHYVDP